MKFVYHLIPKNLVGDTLHPLNQLKEIYPDAYEAHIQKYVGREQVIERQIPLLNCLWNDVLFFTSVHPQAIKDGFMAVGKQWQPQKWYAVDTVAYGFTAENTVIYYPDMGREKADFTLNPERFFSFDVEKLVTVYDLPESTLNYYREATERNELIFAWRGLPHILHCGSISLENIQILEI